MATNSGANLRVRISADLADIKQGMALLRGELAKVKSEAARSVPSTGSWVNGLKEARKQLMGFVAAYASLRTLSALSKVSDEATAISGRLRVATKTQDEFNAAQDETFEIAQRTRSSWQETVSLYARVSSASDSIGLSQQQQLELTESVAKALALSGSYGAEAEGVMRQFGQALGNGRVQAEEFNSILDGGSRIVDALAKHFGIARDQVKKYVNDGKVSSRDLAAAMLKDRADIDASFAKMPGTIGGAFTQIRNSFVRFIGDANDATGASASFSGLLQDIARDLPQFFEPILAVMVQVAKAMKGAEDNADALGEKTSWLAEMGQFLANVFRVLAAGGIVLKNVVEILTVFIAALATGAFQAAEGLLKYLGGAFTTLGNTWDALKEGGPQAAFRAWADSAKGVMDDMASHRRTMVAGFQAATDMIKSDAADLAHGVSTMFSLVEATVGRVRAKASTASSGNGGSGNGNGKGKAVAESNALLRDSVSRALAELDRLYSENEIGMREYFATRLELQQQSIDLEMQQARMSLAATKDLGQRRRLEEQIVKLQRDREDASTKAAHEQRKAENELIDTLGQIKAQLAELDGDAAGAARIRLETQYQDLFKRLEADSDKTGQAMVRNLIDRLVNKAAADSIADRFQRLTSGLQGTEGAISAQMDAGTLGYTEGERRLQEVRQRTLEQLRELQAQQQKYLGTLKEGTPEHAAALQGLMSIETAIANVTASLHKFRQGIEDQGVSALGGFFDDLIEGAETFKEAFRDMVRSFLSGVAKMIAQQLALNAVKAIGSAFGAAHGGGVVGSLRMYRNNIDPGVFAAAPRYHGGGVAGLQNDEIPAILKRGEIVRTRQQENALQARLNAGQGGGEQPIRNIIVFSEDELASALAGTAGEKVVVNHVRRNRGGING